MALEHTIYAVIKNVPKQHQGLIDTDGYSYGCLPNYSSVAQFIENNDCNFLKRQGERTFYQLNNQYYRWAIFVENGTNGVVITNCTIDTIPEKALKDVLGG